MPRFSKAERHIGKSNRYLAEAQDAFREAMAFGITSDPDSEGNYLGDNKDAQRMLNLATRLTERARFHAERAQHLLEP